MTEQPSPRQIRIFLSSPGDLTDERMIARSVIEQIGYDPPFYGEVTFKVVAWEQEGSEMFMPATLPPQEAINRGLLRPSQCDLVVVLFWTRMGTPLPYPDYRKQDGSPYLSGTEYEYLDALEASQKTGQPLVVVYRRTEKVLLDPEDPGFDDKVQQQRQVKAFFETFRGPGGTLRHSYHEYARPEDFRTHFERALRRFVVDLQKQPALHQPHQETISLPERWHGSPFPGLRAFGPDDAPIFFGRGRETDALVEKVRDSRFVAVVGASGSGKSSLVGAGLIPRLLDNAVPGSKDWQVVTFTPGGASGNPFRALAEALVSTFPALIPSPLEAKRLKDEFVAALQADPASLVDTCAAVLAGQPEWAEVLLFVDQFEELFTVVDDSLRTPFVALLAAAAASTCVRVVVTLRADFYHACLKYKPLEELLRIGSFPLGAPGQIALYEMITRPAARAGLEFENGLPERILGDTGSEPGALALMAYTLDELYQTCTRDGGCILSHAAYDALGGVTRAIGTRAENAFNRLPGEEDAKAHTLQRVFHALVEVDERGTATRRRASKAHLLDIEGAAALIEHFASPKVRLLVTSGDEDHTSEVEVAHEALLREWDRLADWIEATQDDRRLIRRVERDAREWDRRGRPEHMLPNAEEIAEYQAALKRFGERVNDPVVLAFTEPEQERLLRELENIDTPHARRSFIGERLSIIGDPRPGVGLRRDGLPDIAWCEVPAGEIALEKDAGTFRVEPFYIARYPVTYIQFQAFLDHPDGFEQDTWWAGLSEEYRKQAVNEQRNKFASYPRDSVSWYQAVAFTHWLNAKLPLEAWPVELPTAPQAPGFREQLLGHRRARSWSIRLPTEWEWQQAATGGDPANEYPWGPEWDNRRANTNEAGLGRATAVGMYLDGKSLAGLLDMGGNVREWCLNEHDRPQNIGLGGAPARVLRGGAFYHNPYWARCAFRHWDYPLNWFVFDGFRVVCARPPSL
ncbi:MAG: SUMF1/EgtB/PvdO family nonheme iron enzyme [Chloroflexi bacterium]|nr:SUMF1/EgtB/PvdO family nonheme iron enzyme [Chloroflexota bacterium]